MYGNGDILALFRLFVAISVQKNPMQMALFTENNEQSVKLALFYRNRSIAISIEDMDVYSKVSKPELESEL